MSGVAGEQLDLFHGALLVKTTPVERALGQLAEAIGLELVDVAPDPSIASNGGKERFTHLAEKLAEVSGISYELVADISSATGIPLDAGDTRESLPPAADPPAPETTTPVVTPAPRAPDSTETPATPLREAGHASATELRPSKIRDNAILGVVRRYKDHPSSRQALKGYRKPTHIGKTPHDLVGRWRQEAGQYRLLDADDEFGLFSNIENGLLTLAGIDESTPLTPAQEESLIELASAYQVVYHTNLRLVIGIAKAYYRFERAVPLIDSIQNGNVGLSKAISRFDISKGWRFSTYATDWVRQEVQRSFANTSRMIRLPVHKHEEWMSLNKTTRELELQLGRSLSPDEKAAVAGLSPTEVQQLQRVGNLYLDSLNATRPTDGRETQELGETIPDTRTIETDFENFADKEAVLALFSSATIDMRTKAILSLRFGLYLDMLDPYVFINKKGSTTYKQVFDGIIHMNGMTLRDVGELFGVTKERIRQIEARGLKRLRKLDNPTADA